MKDLKKLSTVQQNLVIGLVDELLKVNQVYEADKKASKTDVFDLSAIVSDVAEKQKCVNENKVLLKYWKGRIEVQIATDIKKLNKVLNKLGFIVETHAQRTKRVYNQINTERVDRLYISQLTLWDKALSHQKRDNDYHVDIEYQITTDHSKRADLDTPCGMKLRTYTVSETGYQNSNSCNYMTTLTIEEMFAKLQLWVKRYYEQATLVK